MYMTTCKCTTSPTLLTPLPAPLLTFSYPSPYPLLTPLPTLLLSLSLPLSLTFASLLSLSLPSPLNLPIPLLLTPLTLIINSFFYRLRQQINSDELKLSFNDFIIKAAALSMKTVPEVNSSFMDTFIRRL